ncbi:MAG: hypothetical protein ACRDRX_17380 [Pseudonocardiaceae bacterium]
MTTTFGRLPPRPRTVIRAIHVLASVGWLGLVVVMLVLSLVALTTGGGLVPIFLYRLMEQVGTTIIPIFAIATLATGVVLSIATPWGLIRRWWIVVKLILTLVVIATGAGLTGSWIQQATIRSTAPASWLLLVAAITHLMMLAGAIIISIDKPWGKIPPLPAQLAGRVTRRR